MKASDLKVVAIILAIALFFTIVTSNAVSIASVVLLAKGGVGTVASSGTNNTPAGTDAQQGTETGTGDNSGAVVDTNTGDNNTSAPVDQSTGDNTSTTPSDSGSTGTDTPAAPADNNNRSTQGNTQGNNSSKPSGGNNSQKPSGGNTATTWDTAACFNFYKKSCDEIKNKGTAGHTRKEWQTLVDLDLGSTLATNLIKPILTMFIKGEDKASEAVSAKGSDDAKNRMCPCGSSLAYVAKATKQDLPNGNYKITIVMKDENTPKKNSAGIASMSTGILYMEDVQDTVKNDSTVSKIVKSLDKGELMYRAYTITAEMTKDGKFVDIQHYAKGELSAAATTTIGSVSGSGTLDFYGHWYNFKY